MEIHCKIQENGDIEYACICLKTDSWHDYLEFKQEACDAYARGMSRHMRDTCEQRCFAYSRT